jgi:cardiolipin synthase
VFALLTNFIYLISVISILSIIFMERKNPQTTIAWVMVIVFLPVVGVLLYLVLGTSGALTRLFRRRMKKRSAFTDEYSKLLYSQLKQGAERRIKFSSERMERCLDIVRMHLAQSSSLYTTNNDIRIFVDARSHYQDLFDEIRKARYHINVEYFIIQNDEVGRKLVELLAEKAREGVDVRLLYDEFGSFRTNIRFFDPIVQSGGKVCRFYTTRLANLLSVNHRNHRKIVVIDGRVGYTGGMNIGREYMGLRKNTSPWRDTAIKLWGGSVAMLQIRFLLDWTFCAPNDLSLDDPEIFDFFFPLDERDTGTIAAQIVSSGPDVGVDSIKNGYLKMINNARETLYIQTPYLIPDEPMLQALRMAAASGVDVRIMIPGIPDKKFVYAITLSYVEELLKCGIRVYFHEGFLHSKSIVMDDLVASIGTTNFDIRSFALNFEVNAFLYDEGVAQECREIFLEDTKHCVEMTADAFAQRGWGTRVVESIFRLLAYLS